MSGNLRLGHESPEFLRHIRIQAEYFSNSDSTWSSNSVFELWIRKLCVNSRFKNSMFEPQVFCRFCCAFLALDTWTVGRPLRNPVATFLDNWSYRHPRNPVNLNPKP